MVSAQAEGSSSSDPLPEEATRVSKEEAEPRGDRVEYGLKGKVTGQHSTILLYNVEFEV